jgi:methionyl-tRNA synthetase
MTKTFYVTTPIYYVNDRPHIGTAYTTIAADILARYHRAAGYETRFLTGLDEHGQKIAQAAAAADMDPAAFVDRMAQPFIYVWAMLDIAYDDFIRTTQARHAETVRKLWTQVAASGDIYLDTYEGLYCVGCEAYFTEKDLDAEGRCPMGHGRPSKVSIPSYFFRLSRYAQPLLRFYEEHPDFVRPRSRFNEVVSFVREGLRDISISRTNFTWGIPVPGDPGHVMYVWFDALTNYISALGWGGEGGGGDLFERFWPAAHHLIGKDILRFHAVYWPAMLMSAGIAPPLCVFAHGWLTVDGQKMSKSLRNVVDPLRLKWEFGNDATRYYLMRDNVFGLDGDFSHAAFIGRINSDLANDLGNLLSRTITLVRKFLGGRVPAMRDGGPEEATLRQLALQTGTRAAEAYHEARFSAALESIWELCAGANRYIDVRKPWQYGKSGDAAQLATVMAHALETCRWLAAMVAPVMPRKAREMLEILGCVPPDLRTEPPWPSAWEGLAEGQEVREARSLFPRIDESASAAIRGRLEAGTDEETGAVAKPPRAGAATGSSEKKEENAGPKPRPPGQPARTAPPPPASEEELLTIEELRRANLVVGVVRTCGPVEGTTKLLKLVVDTGEPEPRTIVAGVATRYSPDQLIGKRIVVVANLKPAKLRGVMSRGMLLAAEFGDGDLAVLTVDKDVPPGSPVR